MECDGKLIGEDKSIDGESPPLSVATSSETKPVIKKHKKRSLIGMLLRSGDFKLADKTGGKSEGGKEDDVNGEEAA